ncbi:MAG: ferritin-like domain-containing protein [Planctomycetota bacterium]|nr:ferritin-like domain-containing protein [Planctomycetota bacterium]
MIASLNRAISLEVRSFILYILDVANPVLGQEDLDAWELLGRIAEEEKGFAGMIADLIEEAGGNADPASFDMESATYHYVTLDYLLKICVQRMQTSLESFRGVMEEVEDDPGVREVLSWIADAKVRHLAEVTEVIR